jgi:hypothetical protein
MKQTKISDIGKELNSGITTVVSAISSKNFASSNADLASRDAVI